MSALKMIFPRRITMTIVVDVDTLAENNLEADNIARSLSARDAMQYGCTDFDSTDVIGALDTPVNTGYVFDANGEPMPIHTYGCRNRPAMYGTVPDNYVFADDTPTDEFRYGSVRYARALTPREIYSYELLPIDPLPCLPLYQPGTKVRRMNTGKVFEVEAYEGGFVIGDHAMIHLRDWLMYEPVVTP